MNCLQNGSEPLPWRRRYKILQDAARGLQYLHTVQDKPFIHGDIKRYLPAYSIETANPYGYIAVIP